MRGSEVDMTSQLFDIFRKDISGQPVWVEAVENLAVAKHRVFELGAHRPGQYLIFSQKTGQIVSTVTTVASPAARAEHRNEDGLSHEFQFPRTSRSDTMF